MAILHPWTRQIDAGKAKASADWSEVHPWTRTLVTW
jgi:hypothetical protein